jgi:2,3,4,5-tetrahydropyridine-2-carboxylate N-succinyltransferase
MSYAALETAVDAAWEARDAISPATKGETRDAIEATLEALDKGRLRVAEKRGADWHVNQWAKKAVLLGFRLQDMEIQPGGPQAGGWWDKVDSKFKGWTAEDWRAAGFRAVPNCVVRRSAYVAKGAVLMPSFVNVGAYVDEGTMVDAWATVGSCAQIGKNVHLSGGVGIGGVLEPMQAGPTIEEYRRAIEVVEGPSSAKARSLHGRFHRQSPRSLTVKPAKSAWRGCTGRGGRLDAQQERYQPLLRRDREEG